MVALMILGISSGVIVTLFSESLHRIRASESAAQAGAFAQSLLARIEGGDVSLQGGNTQGEAENGFRWHLHAQPYGEPQDREAWPLQAQQVSATVSWGEEKEKEAVTLTTLRLLPKGM